MINFKHNVKNTITLDVKVENLSDDASDIKLVLYRYSTSDGLKEEIKTIYPDHIDGDTIIFIFNTNDFLYKPTTYYAWFTVNNNGIIINSYYRIRAVY